MQHFVTAGLALALGGLVVSIPFVAQASYDGSVSRTEEQSTPEATLVGYGCGDNERTMFGEYEDDFPTCAVIERLDKEPPVVLYLSLDEARAVQGHVFELDGTCRVLAPAGRDGYLRFSEVPC